MMLTIDAVVDASRLAAAPSMLRLATRSFVPAALLKPRAQSAPPPAAARRQDSIQLCVKERLEAKVPSRFVYSSIIHNIDSGAECSKVVTTRLQSADD